MSTTSRRRSAVVRTTAARAVLAALVAVVTTFWPQPDRTAAFGLAVLGAFLILQAVVLAAGALAAGRPRTGPALVLVRAAVSLLGGVVAAIALARGTAPLTAVEALVFLVLGVLEVVGSVRGAGADDGVVVGGLQVVVGLMLGIVGADPLLAIGVLGAWAAVVAVYLGISAATLHRRNAAA